MNVAPKFAAEPSCPDVEVDLEDLAFKPMYKCSLGEIIDPNVDDEITITASDFVDRLMYFDEVTMAIYVKRNWI